ncbi:NUDIX domain-containing protein [Kribbella italica]|uniref:ADP-ribose pyrophosphatase YjhB (NUDIX family) n=1 Tax=Kribbella italica TaxID=1540520 RepID=A0A7W9J704_9ACTN|nr:NUDIX domain-containing protein [Kribbella italica]MBB5836779.1 ADP-ribose pyrophosphatase YjhB (NUDIX family) [Kribbella italica]
MIRAGIILLTDDGVAAIERVRSGRRYHTLPGGGVEPGETSAEAAVRESHEELGLIVKLHGLAAVVNFRLTTQHYYVATALSGTFGTGTGAELTSPPTSDSGSYRAVWLPPTDLTHQSLRPTPIATALQHAASPHHLLETWLAEPPTFDEEPT